MIQVISVREGSTRIGLLLATRSPATTNLSINSNGLPIGSPFFLRMYQIGHCTVIVPDIAAPWVRQWYEYVPALVNVLVKLPEFWRSDPLPSSNVTL